MPRPQISLKAMLVWVVAAGGFWSIVHACLDGEPYALFLMMVWGPFFAGCIAAKRSSAHALLAAFFAFFFLWPLWFMIAAALGLVD
jgi:hypothetical protein